jgi:hypothetical protein
LRGSEPFGNGPRRGREGDRMAASCLYKARRREPRRRPGAREGPGRCGF